MEIFRESKRSTSFQLDYRPLDSHSFVLDNNLAQRFLLQRIFQQARKIDPNLEYRIEVSDLNGGSNGVLFLGRRLAPRGAQRLSKIYKQTHDPSLSLNFLLRALDFFEWSDGQGGSPESIDFFLTKQVLIEAMRSEFYHRSNTEGLLPRKRRKQDAILSSALGLDAVKSDLRKAFFQPTLRFDRRSTPYRFLMKVLTEFEVGGPRGHADRQIVADTWLSAPMKQWDNLSDMAPRFLTADKGILKGLLRIKILNQHRRQPRTSPNDKQSEREVNRIMNVIKRGSWTDLKNEPLIFEAEDIPFTVKEKKSNLISSSHRGSRIVVFKDIEIPYSSSPYEGVEKTGPVTVYFFQVYN